MRTSTTLAGQRACPGCRVMAGNGERNCGNCGIWLAGPQAAELWWIEAEFQRLATARRWLVDRRLALLAELYRLRQQAGAGATAQSPEPAAFTRPVAPGANPSPPPAPSRRPELTTRTAARLLLASGAVLVIAAAIGFTAANWSRVGTLGQCAILVAVTVGVLAAPAILLRRRLIATAESVAAIGLALTIADAVLVQRLLRSPAGGPLTLVAWCTALAAAWAGYGVVFRLRGPRLAAIVVGQLPGVVVTDWLARSTGGPHPWLLAPPALALVVMAGADAALAAGLARRGHRPEMLASSIAATLAWTTGALTALPGTIVAADPASLAWLTGALVCAALAGVTVIPRGSMLPEELACVVSGALLAVGLAVPVAETLPSGWGGAGGAVSAFAICGAVITGGALVVARSLTRSRAGAADRPVACAARRCRLVATGSAALLGLAGVAVTPSALVSMFPAHRYVPAWTGAGAFAHQSVPAFWPGAVVSVAVLALAGVTCWLVPAGLPGQAAAARARIRAVGLIAATLAAGSVPVAAHLTGWAALGVLTAATAALLSAGLIAASRPAGLVLGGAAACCGAVVAASAALWSLATPAATITELAALTVVFALTAARARDTSGVVVGTAGALVTTTGLACAVPLASGWPARYAGFAALAVAVAAVGVATALRRVRPVHALVLDLGAGPVALVCAVLASRQADTFGIAAATMALLASMTAWLRSGRQREITLAGAVCAIVAALAAQGRSLALAIFVPYRLLGHAWAGGEHSYLHAARSAGLPTATVVLATCLAAAVTAVGAWRGSRRSSLDAVAAALPIIAAPAGLAVGFGYWLTVSLLLALTLALTAWAALGQSLVPGGAALTSASLAVGWALAGPVPTLIVLGCLTLAYLVCAWRARRADVKVAAVCLSVLAALATWCAALAVAGVGTPEAYTVPAAACALAAGWAWSRRSPMVSSWLAYGPGLVLLLVPSQVVIWHASGWLRPSLLCAAAAAVALAGARRGLQAPLLTGAAAAVLDAGRELAPAVLSLARAVPGWVPFALIGVGLLWAGATYESRLRNLRSVRTALAQMR